MHNALKGIRTLSPAALDRLMLAMGVTIPEVLWSGGEIDPSAIRAIPLLRNRVGPGSAASFSSFRGYVPFPRAMTTSFYQPVAAYLAPDLAMPAEYRAGDLALLDQNPALRMIPAEGTCWVVAENANLRVRYVRRSHGALIVTSTAGRSGTEAGTSISIQGRRILDIVRARIVWIGRKMETAAAGPDEASGGDD